MKNLTLVVLFVLLSNYGISQCTSAYSQASYALAHTKKSLSSDHFDHQKYYAGRAIEALEKAKTLVESCGCNEATSSIIDALDNMTQAEDPVDWEAGRFYAKHGYEYLQTLMSKLDICTSSSATVNYETTSTPASPTETTSSTTTTLTANTSNTEGSLQAQQQQLELEKQKLLEQQRLLEEKIQKQQQLAEKARVNRQLELEEQLKLKHLAEQSLFNLEREYKELARTLNCSNVEALLKGGYSREDEVLNNETLAQTRAYYLKLTTETQQKIVDALSACSTK